MDLWSEPELTGLRLDRLGFVFQQFNLIPRVVEDATGADVTGLRAVERPVVAVAAAAFYVEALGVEPAAAGLHFAVAGPGHPGVAVVVAALRPRPPLTDPWGSAVSFEGSI